MRIVHYSPGMRLSLGGVVRAVLDWCAVLAARGHEVILVAYDAPDIPADWNGAPGKPKVVRIPPASRPNGFVSADAVKIWRDVLAPGGVAHLHCPWTASNMQMARAARRLGVPYVVSIHGMLDDWPMRRGRLKKRLFLLAGGRKYLQSAARLHYTAAAERAQAEKWIHGPASVLPCLVDLSPYAALPGPDLARGQFNIPRDRPVLLFLSRLDEQKGVHILLEAAAAALKTAGPFHLIIAGPGSDPDYDRHLKDSVRRLNLRDTVQFTGLVGGAAKLSLFQAADLFVLPTQHENMGLVLVEALAAGCPVLTTRGTDFWPEIESAGGRVTGVSADEFARALSDLLACKDALPALGRRGRDWAMKRFEMNALAAEYESLYLAMRKV